MSPYATRTLPTLGRRGAGTLAAVVTLLGLAACAPQPSTTSSGGSGSGAAASASGTSTTGLSAACAPGSLTLKNAGKLTVGTDSPAYSPWFEDNKPTNGKGYESAVAYAVAAKLGFASGDVNWVTASFNSSFAPGAKTFDVFINQVSITAKRAKAVDFSPGYYSVTQAVVTVKGSKIAKATTIAALAGAKLGAQVGTTSYDAIKNQIKPSKDPAVFNTNDDAVKSLENGQIDGLVVDLPTALYLAAAEIDGGVVVGQLPLSGGTPEQFGLVLEKDSKLTACVGEAVTALQKDGTLAKLEKTWLTDSAGAPVLS